MTEVRVDILCGQCGWSAEIASGAETPDACPACGVGAKDFSRDARKARRPSVTAVSLRGRKRTMKLPDDPSELHEHFKRLGEMKIAQVRESGYEPRVDPEDVAQAGMLARYEAERGGHDTTVMYRAMDDEIARSASVAEAPLRIMREVMAMEAEEPNVSWTERAFDRVQRLGVQQQYRRSSPGTEVSAQPERRIDPGFAQRLASVIKTLMHRERIVLEYRYGLLDGVQSTLEEVGEIFRITSQRVRQIEVRAIKKLHDRLGDVDVSEVFYELNPRKRSC